MSVYILISLNIKQGRGSNLSSAVKTSAVSGDKMTGRGVLDALLLDMTGREVLDVYQTLV